MQANSARRPLKVRASKYPTLFAKWLSQKGVSPNSISLCSVFFAALAATVLIAFPYTVTPYSWILPVLAALFIQCRLLCNLFDGMVAVEGGKGTPSGELFNDIPDRIADPLILIAAGYAATPVEISYTLGWCAGLLAVMTAYIRTLASSIGAPTSFQGPMAKQHRMALITGACLLTTVESHFWPTGLILTASLCLIILGSIITCYNRARAAYKFMESL